MGFFFSQAKQSKRTPKGLRNAPTSKQNAGTLNRLGCRACPLNNADVSTPKMPPTLATETLVYFLAEAPGRDEDENSGRPLTGPSGKLLRECIPKEDVKYCSFDNVIRDRPPENRTPTWNEIECCRGNVTGSIEKAKPKLIVGLGLIPLTWMLGSSDIAGMRGRVFAVKIGTHECWFMPTYHPSFILRKAQNRNKPLNSMMGHCFRMDISKAFKLLDTLPKAKVDTENEARAGVQTFAGPLGLPDLLKLLSEARSAPVKAVDIETSTLRPYALNATILTIAISYGETHFSFALNHPKTGWSKEALIALKGELRKLLVDNTIKIAHNAPFEIEWLIKYLGLDVVNHTAWECTMMQAHFLDERRGKQARGGEEDARRATYQSLDFLCKQHFGIAYKKLFKLPKKDMAKADLGETLTYNGVDTKYTLRLWHLQTRLLKQQKLQNAYLEALPRQPTVAIMQHLGVDVDQKKLGEFKKKLGGEIKGLTDEVYKLKVVKAFIADRKEFNPFSGPDTIAIFKDYLHCKEVIVEDKYTKEVKYSVDKNVLDQIDHPLAKMIVELRNRTKLKSTYIDGFELGKGNSIWPDGKLHTSFNTTFAETGRLSSDEPNLQNFPQRKDAWVRETVVPPKDHILLAFDYGQLEACTAAVCSKDKVLVKALWEDYDIHMEWTERLVKEYPNFIGGSESLTDKVTAKKYRSVVKNKLVFPAIFGASVKSIAGYLKSPEDKIESLMIDFWNEFDGLKNWQDKLMAGYYDDGYVESPTGRRHYYPLTRNQAINMPIQAFACDIVCDGMNRLSYMASDTNQWHLHPYLNIHDDLTFFIPDDENLIEDSINHIYKIMLTPPYKYMNVPLSVSASIGTSWFKPGEIAKFWSHKDL